MIKTEYVYLWHLAVGNRRLQSLENSSSSVLQKFTLLVLVYLLLNLLLVLIIAYPLSILFPEIISSYQAMDDMEATEIFFQVVILGPFLEELLFRLPLKFKKVNLRIWLFMIFLISFNFHYVFSIGAFMLWVGYMFHGKKRPIDLSVKRFYNKRGHLIFWVSSLLFAWIHIYNFNLEVLPEYLYIVAILPQLLSGIFMGVIRLRFGLGWAILHHTLFNLITVLVSGAL